VGDAFDQAVGERGHQQRARGPRVEAAIDLRSRHQEGDEAARELGVGGRASVQKARKGPWKVRPSMT
jgi:hypothetical protein